MVDDSAASARSHLDALVGASRVPGVQYVVVDEAGVLCDFAGGWSEVGRQVALDSASTLMAYSMSKTVTAVAVLQLVEAGALDLDRSVQDYLDAFPYPAEITIRHLLSHTSGIPNPIPLRWVHPEERHTGFDESKALEAVMHRHSKLAFRPGAKYAYSNIGYWLLGRVLERAADTDFRSYVVDRILKPLGLGRCDLGYGIADGSKHAGGYLERFSFMNLVAPLLVETALLGPNEGRWRRIRSHYANGPAFGGLVGTARAFGHFLQDQLADRSRLLGEAGRRLLREQQHAHDGAPVPMTLGWHIGTLGGQNVLFKEGGGGGFHCLMRVYPAWGIGSVLMTNATQFNVAGCLNNVDPLFAPLRA